MCYYQRSFNADLISVCNLFNLVMLFEKKKNLITWEKQATLFDNKKPATKIKKKTIYVWVRGGKQK